MEAQSEGNERSRPGTSGRDTGQQATQVATSGSGAELESASAMEREQVEVAERRDEALRALGAFAETLEHGEWSPESSEVAEDTTNRRILADADERGKWSPAVGDGFSAAAELAYGHRVPPRAQRIL